MSSDSRRLRFPFFAIVGLCLFPRAALAEDKAGAAALFAEAGRLVDNDQAASACPKYEESLKLYESTNTRYFLADCYERVGRTASAWALFLEVAARVHEAGDAAKEEKARERATAVQARVSHLVVVVPRADIAGLEVKRDGLALGRGQWGVAMPVDPGEHLVEAGAPGKKPWSSRVRVEPNGARASIAIGALENAPTDSSSERWRPRRTIALAVGGAGIVTMGVATALAFAAKSRFDEASEFCNGDRCTQTGVDIRESAVDRGNVATAVFGVGLAALVGGGVLWFTAPRSSSRASLAVSPTAQGLLVRGSF
jgi:hypothetical protein